MRNKKLLDEFVSYCHAHPEERFWQALRNWAGFAFIFADDGERSRDTFYWEGRDG